LVAADDGQRPPPRPIPDSVWRTALSDTDADIASSIGDAAFTRNNIEAAFDAYERAAAAGNAHAMDALGYLCSKQDPPNMPAARQWYEQAAAANDPDAMFHLGVLLSNEWDPPDLIAARHWYEQATATGYPDAETILDLIHHHGH
jgi:TPR repeat protein